MKMPSKPEFDLQRAFDEGRAKPLCVEVRRKGRHEWTSLAKMHEQEIADVQRLSRLVPHDTRNVHIGIHPDTGRVGVFVVAGDEQQLDLANGGASPAAASERAQELAQIVAGRMAAALQIADGVFARFTKGEELAYEDVFDALPEGVPEETLKAALCQGHLPQIDVALAGQAASVGGRIGSNRELITRDPVEFVGDVRDVDQDGKPNGTARMNIVSLKNPGKRLAGGLGLGKSVEAQLRTSNNDRARRLLNLAAAHSCNVAAKVQMCLNLSNGRMSFVLEEINTVDLIRQIRPIQLDLLDSHDHVALP